MSPQNMQYHDLQEVFAPWTAYFHARSTPLVAVIDILYYKLHIGCSIRPRRHRYDAIALRNWPLN